VSRHSRLARVAAALLLLAACEREHRDFHGEDVAEASDSTRTITVGTQSILPGDPSDTTTAPTSGPYQENAWAVSEGERLFSQMNCTGCHATYGGGGIGPALRDSVWIYGSAPAQVFETILQGRPDGMPAFGSKLPDSEIWKLVAYVRSLSHLTPLDTWPVRSDHLPMPAGHLKERRRELGDTANAKPPGTHGAGGGDSGEGGRR
jgi:cytochrome c oxidase cbb3-type subunit III